MGFLAVSMASVVVSFGYQILVLRPSLRYSSVVYSQAIRYLADSPVMGVFVSGQEIGY